MRVPASRDEKPSDGGGTRPKGGEGLGIDRSAIRQRLKLTPAERVHLSVEEARNLQRLRERVRR